MWPQNRLHRSPTSWFFLWFSNDFGVNVIRHQNDLIQQSMTSHTTSGVASPTIWSCYANISVFIDRENNRFLKKWIMMIWYLHSMTKLSGWLHHCSQNPQISPRKIWTPEMSFPPFWASDFFLKFALNEPVFQAKSNKKDKNWMGSDVKIIINLKFSAIQSSRATSYTLWLILHFLKTSNLYFTS